MSEIIERAARAMHDYNCLAVPSLGAWDTLPEDYREQYLGRARAAIAAMREPTEAMADAGRWDAEDDGPFPCWRAMIDEALKP